MDIYQRAVKLSEVAALCPVLDNIETNLLHSFLGAYYLFFVEITIFYGIEMLNTDGKMKYFGLLE